MSGLWRPAVDSKKVERKSLRIARIFPVAMVRRPLLDEEAAAFIQGGVSILASSCDGECRMSVVRAVGCRVSPDRLRVTVLVPASHPFLDMVIESRRIAVAYTLPSTHRALQLKGDDAVRARSRKDDVLLSERYVKAFASNLCPLGYTEAFARSLAWCDPAEIAAVAFRPAAAFVQTPGPRAGERLAS